MKDQFAWGIVSTGQMASDMARAFAYQRGSRMLSVCSRTDEKARDFAGKFGIERACSDYGEFLSDDDLDVVYIASPHNAHFSRIMAALNAGRNVVCEKPLTLNAPQARLCRDTARERDLFLMEAVWMRFFPLMEKLREFISSGRPGKPVFVSADFFLNVGNPGHRLFNPALAGGALLDLGLYPLNLAQMILGPLESISGHANLNADGIDVLDTMSVRAGSGGSAALACGLTAAKPREAFLAFSECCVKINNIFFRPDTFIVGYGGEDAEIRRIPYHGNGYTHEILHVEKCLRANLKESPLMPLDDTVNVLSMMDDFRKQWSIRYSDKDESHAYEA